MRFDLTQIRLVDRLLRSRWPQFVLTSLALVGFLVAILTGFLGTPVGSRNFGIIFVWIAWWAILMLLAVPFFGRAWCGICPIPAPGEWIQRGALLQPGRKKGLSLGKRWPNRLRNIWIQNGSFVLVAIFSTVVLTQPRVTAVVLAGFLFLSIGASLIFERRAFCRYLCPVGGFIGLYSQLAPLEVRVKDPDVCAGHKVKTCYIGSADGYGCPWQVFPPGQIKNTYCGTCMECLRTCPQNNIAIQIRSFGADLAESRGRRLDEAFKAFIMLGSALVYSLVLLGPYDRLKLAAYSVGSLPWIIYATTFILFVLVGLPGLFFICVESGRRLARSKIQVKRLFIKFAAALIPLGLAAWAAFSLSFVLANLSYVWMVISDPFGWGWNLFGTSTLPWTPYLTRVIPAIQAVILLGGLCWSLLTVRRLAGENLGASPALVQSLPVMAFCWVMTLAMFGVLLA